MMTCRDCTAWLGDQAAGLLTPAQASELERHLAVCPECRREAERFRASVAALESAFADLPAPRLATAVLARVREAERPVRPWWVPALAGVGLMLAMAVPFGLTARPALSDPEVLQAYADDLAVVAAWDETAAESADNEDWTLDYLSEAQPAL